MNISVVVPTYNRAELLRFTLDAILAQTLPPGEIIVVDDGSQDATAALLGRYAPRVRAIRIANSGPLVARNSGLDAAAGDLVGFCDSDDLWTPEFLARMAALWQAEPAVAAAYSDFVFVRDGKWEATSRFRAAPAGFWDGLREVGSDLAVFDRPVVDRLLRYQPFFPSCMVVRRHHFRAIGGWDRSVGRVLGGDFATALRVAEHPPLGVVGQALVGIRKHASNISADARAAKLGDSMVLEHVLAMRPTLARYAPQIRASIEQRRRQAFDSAFALGDFAGVRTIYDMLPVGDRPPKLRLKRLIAGLPAGLRRAAGIVLLRAGSTRAQMSARMKNG